MVIQNKPPNGLAPLPSTFQRRKMHNNHFLPYMVLAKQRICKIFKYFLF